MDYWLHLGGDLRVSSTFQLPHEDRLGACVSAGNFFRLLWCVELHLSSAISEGNPTSCIEAPKLTLLWLALFLRIGLDRGDVESEASSSITSRQTQLVSAIEFSTIVALSELPVLPYFKASRFLNMIMVETIRLPKSKHHVNYES